MLERERERESSSTGDLCMLVFVLYVKPVDSINNVVYPTVNPESVNFGFQFSHIFSLLWHNEENVYFAYIHGHVNSTFGCKP